MKLFGAGLLAKATLVCGLGSQEAQAQTEAKKTNLKSVMVLEHGTGPGHRASSDHLNAILRDLGTTHGFTVKVLSQSVDLNVEFSAQNLATYQVVILSNNDGVHRFIQNTARNNFQAYVENGGGLLAVHAASAFIDGWSWIDNALVAKFYGPHQSSGPAADLRQDPEASKDNSQTAGIVKGLTAPAAFIDEYYQFQSNVHPRGKTGVTILLTVQENTSNIAFQSPMGADHPVAWSKPVGKGRVVHNSLGHSFGERGHNVYTQKSNYLKNFTYNALRFAAGDFIGCMDSTFVEYNPEATQNDQSMCETVSLSRISIKNADSRSKSFSQFVNKEPIKVEITAKGRNHVAIVDMAGKTIESHQGNGPKTYSLVAPDKPGFYMVKVNAGGEIKTQRITVL